MEVFASRFLGLEELTEGYIIRVSFDVASGVYIRSLVEYLGKFLDTPATLANLRRTKIGEFDLSGAKKV